MGQVMHLPKVMHLQIAENCGVLFRWHEVFGRNLCHNKLLNFAKVEEDLHNARLQEEGVAN